MRYRRRRFRKRKVYKRRRGTPQRRYYQSRGGSRL